MCNRACYNVLCHASSVDNQGDNFLATVITRITIHLTLELIHFPGVDVNQIGFWLKTVRFSASSTGIPRAPYKKLAIIEFQW